MDQTLSPFKFLALYEIFLPSCFRSTFRVTPNKIALPEPKMQSLTWKLDLFLILVLWGTLQVSNIWHQLRFPFFADQSICSYGLTDGRIQNWCSTTRTLILWQYPSAVPLGNSIQQHPVVNPLWPQIFNKLLSSSQTGEHGTQSNYWALCKKWQIFINMAS